MIRIEPVRGRMRLAYCRHPRWFHAGHSTAHVAYLVFAFAEGHGAYAVAGAVLLGFALYNLIIGEHL